MLLYRRRLYALPSRRAQFILPMRPSMYISKEGRPMQLQTRPTSANWDETFDFSEWAWIKNGDTITSATCEVLEGDVTASIVATTDTTVTFNLSGGTDGAVCKVMIKAQTLGGRVLPEAADFKVLN